MNYPAGLRYSKTHEWLKVEGKSASVGITDHAQELLGDIVFVELPKVGNTVTAGNVFGSVESVKAVNDLFAPASGTVTAINDGLGSQPELINSNANETWIFKMDLADLNELESSGLLLDSTAYEAFVEEEAGH